MNRNVGPYDENESTSNAARRLNISTTTNVNSVGYRRRCSTYVASRWDLLDVSLYEL